MFTTDRTVHDPALLQQAQRDLMHCESYKSMQDLLLDLIQKNDTWRTKKCINLVAAESPMSRLARSLLACDLSMRTAGGHIGKKNRNFMATQYIDQLESMCHVLLTNVFECHYCEHRLLGGTQACHVVYSSLIKPNDTLITVMPEHGGDSSNCSQSMPGLLGLNIIPMPFLPDQLTVDLNQLEYLVCRYRPQLIALGFSICLFEQPLKEICTIAQKYKVRVFYDAAHELGLIAGKCFANPFKQGITVMSGSTGKTFSGPQGGLLLWDDDELIQPIASTVFPNFVGTYQLNRVAALTLTTLELQQYGERYMAQVVHNAKALAMHLYELGIPVFAKEKNYTQTHQVLINAKQYGGGFVAANQLEACNIIGNHVNIPGDNKPLQGLRIATTEITRRGMKETHMRKIAEFIYRALATHEPAHYIAHEVSLLSEAFQEIYYC
ncbi:aminotransferase class I/II-fold pyridoxal phosphate-dependent enzyme [Legionella anisa]|uniref:Serine hydroxymethyltransferase n=2 Tax=Legionella anisa TaxID=28082 RepID=A0AAX0WTS3_9GAMM|nr:aminotransferase class I/II-fold pyridoxal phosphate-dependent enzyme [Legionella anisa]AWN74691.1 serine hydroxymethyltransferase [Legionella anisa]KTC77487.1 serine hydroxymethyltransferase [Legionella anisa]MCW8449390.1 aminotransferase class I/II-fold pyridoxal phosphate-dependent enzyme [Legionella anisa]PNL61413.1 serine hydroxymethyltransferase [Legionella anisa]UAK81190.1 aminotransferase class I/II-fold pyridoxal phosphate-dependent enzyme [Legionella anisa]